MYNIIQWITGMQLVQDIGGLKLAQNRPPSKIDGARICASLRLLRACEAIGLRHVGGS